MVSMAEAKLWDAHRGPFGTDLRMLMGGIALLGCQSGLAACRSTEELQSRVWLIW